ncbi:MAG: CpsD/CapB family tyrosine-protein kinase [Anaerolineae bacterium]|nr:CpsD/CapB family tyrosine-protein kinase [Anaerolineae bacterium]
MSLITLTDPRSPQSEAYRTLRTNLSFYSLDKPLQTLVVTSPAPDQGKDIALANLAVTMAQGGKRTIAVDCDLRRPTLHNLFAVQNETGFTEMVLDEAVAPPLRETSVENLWLLTSGAQPPNSADLLGTKQVDRVLATLLEHADIVLLSAPPVISVTDAVILGAKSDGVLLVVQAGKTRRDQAERAKQTLDQANVRIVGVTLTNATIDSAVGSYG